jgi:hypothetical protein
LQRNSWGIHNVDTVEIVRDWECASLTHPLGFLLDGTGPLHQRRNDIDAV